MKKLIFLLIPVALVALGFGMVTVEKAYLKSARPVQDIGGPFALTAPDGRVVTDQTFRGKLMVVYFGYTQCPDACPTALTNIANALDMMKGKARDIAPVFITVDPERDTKEVMGHYVSLFGNQIVGLTGTQAQIDHVTAEYRVYAARHPEANGNYSMDHSSIIYLMDKEGHFKTVMDGAAEPGDIAATLTKADS